MSATRRSRRLARPALAAVLFLLAGLAPAAASEGPGVEILWSRGGMSGPYELESFHDPNGDGVFAAGYTGGVVAVDANGLRWRYSDGSQLANAIFEDVTGDGLEDAILANYPGTLAVLDGADGSLHAARTFPKVPEGLAVGEATGDGLPDIYAVTQGVGATNTVSLLDGRTLSIEWTVDLGVDQQYVLAADSADLDDDARDDVVFGTYANGPKVYAYGSDGTKLWQADGAGAVSNVVVADGGDSVFASRTGTQLAALDAKTGAARWSLTGNGGFSRLEAGDMDGDGTDDAVWALYGSSGKSASWQVMAVDGGNGLPLWTVPTGSPPKGLTVGDIDGDGGPDVAATTQDVSSNVRHPENFVWAIDGSTGRPLWTHVLSGDAPTYLSDVTLADMAGDSKVEVVAAPYFERLLGLSPTDGARTWSADLGSTSLDAAAFDLDGDGAEEVIEGSADFRLAAREGATGAVRWSTDLGGEVSALSNLQAGAGRDVIAASPSVVHRVRGSDGSVLWSRPVEGMISATAVIERSGGDLVAVGAQLRRVDRGVGHTSVGGSLSVLDAATGLPKWHVQVPGTPWELIVKDVSGDGVKDLVTGSPTAQQAVTVYDGARLDSAPVPLWLTPADAGASALTVAGGRVISVRPTTRRVVAQDGVTGAEAWSYTHPVAVRSLGFDDLTGDGVDEALLGTEVFSERIVAVDGATGQKLFDLAAGIKFIKAAASADVSGDGVADLVYASDGGTFGKGGVFAIDGTTLGGPAALLWSHERINAWGLEPLELPDGTAWVAFGVTTLPDAVAVLRPLRG